MDHPTRTWNTTVYGQIHVTSHQLGSTCPFYPSKIRTFITSKHIGSSYANLIPTDPTGSDPSKELCPLLPMPSRWSETMGATSRLTRQPINTYGSIPMDTMVLGGWTCSMNIQKSYFFHVHQGYRVLTHPDESIYIYNMYIYIFLSISLYIYMFIYF